MVNPAWYSISSLCSGNLLLIHGYNRTLLICERHPIQFWMSGWMGGPPVKRVQHEKRSSGGTPTFISFMEGNKLTEEQKE